MEAMFLGLNLLLGYAVWRFIWRKTSLDTHRDQLFDLRDEVKAFFTDHGYGLDHPLYNELRALLNGHIRYTEHLTLRLFVAQTVAMSAHPEIAQSLKEKINARLRTDDTNLAEFIDTARKKSVVILTAHMVETSFVFLMVMPFIYFALVIYKAFTFAMAVARNHNAKLLHGLRTAFRFAPIAGFMLAFPARAGIIDKSFDANIVEEYSYQAANC
jgi:hypothetical protein